jgi:hypothetical protein
MTLSAVTTQVWEALGEPSDLNPSSVGVARLREAINDAQDAIAMWTDNRGRKVPFRELEDVLRFTSVVETGTLETQSSLSSITLPNAVPGALGRYTGWMIRINGETRRVVSSTIVVGANVLGLGAPLTVSASDADYELAKVAYELSGTDAIDTDMRIMEIQRVFDPEAGAMLDEVGTRDFLYASGMGVPGSWAHWRQGILFDVAPETARTYELHVTRLPTTVAQQTDVLEMPDTFCQAIVLRATWWGFRRMQDFNAAYATKREFEEMMMRMASSRSLNEEPDYFTVRSR